MTEWNFKIEEAPKIHYKDASYESNGKTVERVKFEPIQLWLASKCGIVTVSYWLPKEGRWNMFKKGEQPIAWQPYPVPKHPNMEAANA